MILSLARNYGVKSLLPIATRQIWQVTRKVPPDFTITCRALSSFDHQKKSSSTIAANDLVGGVTREQEPPRTKTKSKTRGRPARPTCFDQWGSYEVEPGVRCNKSCIDGKLIDHALEVPDVETVWQAFQNGVKVSRYNNCLGWRDGNVYKWWSFEEVDNRIRHLASALSNAKVAPGEFIGIYSASRPEWMVVSLACSAMSIPIVPLYDMLGQAGCTSIINQVKSSLFFVDTAAAARRLIINAKSTPSLRRLVLFNEPDADMQNLAQQQNITLTTLDKFMSTAPEGQPVELRLPKPDDTCVVLFTSGTTGDPKGVILTHRSMTSLLNGIERVHRIDYGKSHNLTKDEVGFLFLPLAHVYGLQFTNWFLYHGRAVGFFSGNILKVMEDAEILKPTYVALVPRLMNRVYSTVLAELSKSALKSKLFWYAYQRKRDAFFRGIMTRDSIWDKIVFKKIQNKIGGRLTYCSIGSAPVAEEVLEFWRIVFGALVIEGYGMSESSAVISLSLDPNGGNVGHPIQCNYVKLADVPECGYTVSESGRGEICVKGNNVMVGYYNQPEKTAEALDADGWLHTGDIGQFLPNGCLKIVDRKKNIFKLAQGEFIAPEKIENVYLLTPEILQIFVDGSTLQPYIVAIVVPEPTMAKQFAVKNGLDLATLYKNPKYVKFLLDTLTTLGKENKLNSLEQVKAITLTDDVFSIEKGLLTPTMKNKRTQLRRHFQQQIDALYKAGPMI